MPERLLGRYGLQPREALRVDDDPVNVEGARLAGLQAHVFRDPAALRKKVRRRGVIQ